VELIPGPKYVAGSDRDAERVLRSEAGQGRGDCERYAKLYCQSYRHILDVECVAIDGHAGGMTIEEVDACTGPAIGQPKSATFRTADIVGIDVLVHVVKNIYESVPNDESREMYRVPVLGEEMVRRGWLGDKTGQGFYKRVKGSGEREILTHG